MKIKNPITKGNIDSLKDTMSSAFSTFSAYKKISNIEKARVVFLDSNYKAHGMTDKDKLYCDVNISENLAKIKGLDRIFIVLSKYTTADGENLIFLSDGQLRSIDFLRVSEYQNKNMLLNKLDLLEKNISKLDENFSKIENPVKCTLNILPYEKEILKLISCDAEKIAVNNVWRHLDDLPNRTALFIAVAVFFATGVFWATVFFIFMIIIQLLQYLIK